MQIRIVLLSTLSAILFSCTSVKMMMVTGTEVSSALEQLQDAIDQIYEESAGSVPTSGDDHTHVFPELQSATIKLNSAVSHEGEAEASLILFAKGKASKSNSSEIVIELAPKMPRSTKSGESIGRQLADQVIEAVRAIHSSETLALTKLTVTAQLEFSRNMGKGFEAELSDIGLSASHSQVRSSGHSLTLVFAPRNANN